MGLWCPRVLFHPLVLELQVSHKDPGPPVKHNNIRTKQKPEEVPGLWVLEIKLGYELNAAAVMTDLISFPSRWTFGSSVTRETLTDKKTNHPRHFYTTLTSLVLFLLLDTIHHLKGNFQTN